MGTWVNSRRLPARVPQRLRPDDVVSFGAPGQGSLDFKVCMFHNSLLESGGRHGSYDRRRAAEPQVALSGK